MLTLPAPECLQGGAAGSGKLSPAPAPERRSRVTVGFCYAAILALSGLLTHFAFATTSEFGRHPDEAAHFVTGTMVRDWVVSGCPRPVEFAREYYAHYPKVGLGHWPPLFYGIQGLWYAVFGVSTFSAYLLVNAICGAYLGLLFAFLYRRLGIRVALATVVLVATSEIFRYDSQLVMADLLVALFGLLAMWAFTKFLKQGGAGSATLFGVFAALAVLTKQDAVSLLAIPFLSLLLLRRWDLLRQWRFYAPLVLIALATGGVALMTRSFTSDSWVGLDGPGLWEKFVFLIKGLSLGGWAGMALAAFGCLVMTVPRWRIPALKAAPAVFLTQGIGHFAVQMMTPVSLDMRYKTSLLCLTALLTAAALYRLSWQRRLKPATQALVLTALTLLVLASQPTPRARSVTGYRGVAQSLAKRSGLQVIMICSDTMGDGAVVSEFQIQQPLFKVCVLRADKMLASSTWMGANYKMNPETDTVEKIDDYLTRQPVHFLILDEWGEESGEHYRLLNQLVAERPERYELVATYPIIRRIGGVEERQARVYRVGSSSELYPEAISFRIPSFPGGEILRASSPLSCSCGRQPESK